MSPRRHERFIALLRGINVTGRNKIPMADLRVLCSKNGFIDVETYIQSGNVVLSAPSTAEKVERDLENLIERRFGLSIPVIVRQASAWPTYVESNPFPDASISEPNAVLIALSKKPPLPTAVEALRERAAGGELVERSGDAIWIHFRSGMGRSKLLPGVFDRLVGSPVTMRNWRTVLKLRDMTAG